MNCNIIPISDCTFFIPECFIQCVLMQRGANGQSVLVKKRNFRMWSEDELRKMVTPELVSFFVDELKHLFSIDMHDYL